MNKISFLLLISISLSCSHQPEQRTSKYQRDSWNHWTDVDDNCLNTRAEILRKRSLVKVQMNKRGCGVKTGKWNDYYYPEVHTIANKVDIDHVVPLKYAHDHGASNWTKAQKERFANDPDNLVITNRSYNRQKGAKGIDQWLPVHKDYACKYMREWMKIKKKYELKVGEKERNAIQGC